MFSILPCSCPTPFETDDIYRLPRCDGLLTTFGTRARNGHTRLGRRGGRDWSSSSCRVRAADLVRPWTSSYTHITLTPRLFAARNRIHMGERIIFGLQLPRPTRNTNTAANKRNRVR